MKRSELKKSNFFFIFSDDNECLTNPCHSAANCTNTIGSFECECLEGYSGNRLVCQGTFLYICYIMLEVIGPSCTQENNILRA